MGIITGVFVSLITLVIIWLGKYLISQVRKKHLKEFFGEDVISINQFFLVYAEFVLPKVINGFQLPTHPFKKPDRESSGMSFSISKPLSSCEVRAIKYLSESLYKEGSKSLLLSSDYELMEKLNISFITFGGPASNYKTRDIMENSDNNLIYFDNAQFTSVKSGKRVLSPDPKYDYGIILKIHSQQFPHRTWIACAGIAEWGTSGATWYLAKKWKDLYKFAKKSPFVVIVRVNKGQDESAIPVVKVKNQNDISKYES